MPKREIFIKLCYLQMIQPVFYKKCQKYAKFVEYAKRQNRHAKPSKTCQICVFWQEICQHGNPALDMQASHHARCPTAAAHPCSPPPPTVSLFSPPASVLFRRIQAVNGSSKPDKTKVSTSRTTKDGEKYPGADFQAAILSAPFQSIDKNRLSNPHASSLLTANRPGDKTEPPALPGLLAKSETLSSDRLRSSAYRTSVAPAT